MLTEKDRMILKEVQDHFPLVPRPWEKIGRKLALSESSLIRRAKELKKRGLIRYVGVVFDLQTLGLKSTLIAMKVPTRRIRAVAGIVNGYQEVSHNYLRKGGWNLWFTLTAGSEKRLNAIMREIKSRTGVKNMLDLRTEKVFKINAAFPLR